MAKSLFSLFDEGLKRKSDLVTSPSQSLESISKLTEEQELIIEKVQQFKVVEPKVNYSDFKNHVFFNSALDYFNITGEKILNEYPIAGSIDKREKFLTGLDGYQRHVLDVWPKSSGSLSFKPAQGFAYVSVSDVGSENGIQRTSFLSPNTGSLSIEFWCKTPPVLTGSSDIMVITQKISGSLQSGYTTFFSGSNLFFNIKSGSYSISTSVPVVPGTDRFFSCVYNKDSTIATLSIATGSFDSFPVRVSLTASTINGGLSIGSSKFNIASGTLAGKTTVRFTGSLDDVSVWNVARTTELSKTDFNTKRYAQKNLLALWRFNESGSIGPVTGTPDTRNSICFDSSGKGINGKIINYYRDIRTNESLVPLDTADPILSIDSRDVLELVVQQQLSGSLYDRDNSNLITRLIPEKFILLEEEKNTEVIKNFLYILARQFDFFKIRIDQFVNTLRTNYSEFDQTPDALLEDVGRFFGWEFTGNFLDSTTSQYILGKNVLPGTALNEELDTKLFQIKNEFWKRTLLNLIHIYKTKGTRESVESLLRIYGVNKNFVRLKEYGVQKNVGIETHRIHSEKSVAALAFGSGSVGSYAVSNTFPSQEVKTVEMRVRFPTQTSDGIQATLATGSLLVVRDAVVVVHQKLYFTKTSATSLTGNLVLSCSAGGELKLMNAPIFDGRWHNISFSRNPDTSTLKIDVRTLDGTEIVSKLSDSAISTVPVQNTMRKIRFGSSASLNGQQWMQEIRVWNTVLSDAELDDHTLNFQSFGTLTSNGTTGLITHLRLSENVSADGTGNIPGTFTGLKDVSGNGIGAWGVGFVANENPFKKFLFDYNYIASPEYGWSEDKIRILNANEPPRHDMFNSGQQVGLEFNMVDALNEDISQIVSTLDIMNNIIGSPANRYRDEYSDIKVLRDLYFKRLSGRLNFKLFFDMLEFFDRSFIEMIKKLLPAKTTFMGDELVVESHMLERPKLQWNYRRQEKQLDLEGVIKVFIRS